MRPGISYHAKVLRSPLPKTWYGVNAAHIIQVSRETSQYIFLPSSLVLLEVAPPACFGIGVDLSSSANPRFLNSSGAIRLLGPETISAKFQYPITSYQTQLTTRNRHTDPCGIGGRP